MPNAPRYYQTEAVNAVFDYWSEEAGNPLVDMATGTGKSLTEAIIDMRLVKEYPDMRVLNTTHVVELVEGNWLELLGIWPTAPVGVAAASLERRDLRSQILFTQLQSVYDKAARIGHVDVMKIDEVHLVPNNENTMYRKFIDALLGINPEMKIVGFSATPYRLDSGRLDEGDDRLFDRVVYTYGIRQGIEDGYLTPITSKPIDTRLDVSGVGKAMGDFKKGDLAAAVDKDDLNRTIIEEVMDVEGHRKKALFFCAGIEHATHMRDILREMSGRTIEVLSGKTPKGERRTMLEAYKRGEIWAITNDNVMSTGTNVPGIDLIVDCAPTASAPRYVQRVGRGTRVIWPRGFQPEATDAEGRRAAIASGIKPNCRYMNFAGNIERHGPVDMIEPKRPGKGDGEAPIKTCPQCDEILHASFRECWFCGHQFEFSENTNLMAHSSSAPIISTQEPEWSAVSSQTFRRHEKAGGLPSVRVDYMVGLKNQRCWLCPEHTGSAKTKSDRFWVQHGGLRPFPKSVEEFLDRAGELTPTGEIQIKFSGKWPDVVDFRAAAEGTAVEVKRANTSDAAERKRLRELMEDNIPF